MKRILTVLLALTLVLSLTLTSFAAVTINFSFKALDENGDEYVYHFGTFDPATDKEVGLQVGDNEYPLDDAAYEKAVSVGGKFGIGLIDKNNVYGGEYTVTPYTKDENYVKSTASAIKVVESEYTLPEITYDEPVLALNGYGSLTIENGNYSAREILITGTNKNDAPALTLETKTAAYLTFDISALKGINEDRLITITFANYRQGPNLGQYIYMYGMTDENKIDTINETVISNKYNIAYDADINNGAHTPMTATFNVTNYIKNKLINGETTATFVYVLKSTTVNAGYLAYQGSNKPTLNYVDTASYEGEDKDEEFVGFYAEKDIPVVKAGNIALKTGAMLNSQLWQSGAPVFVSSYDPNYSNATGSRPDDNAFFDFDISAVKGINDGRKLVLDFGLRRRAPQSATGIYIDVLGVIDNETTMISEDIHFDTLNSGTKVVRNKVDVTDYIKTLIAKGINTARIVFTVEYTDDTAEEPHTDAYVAIALGNLKDANGGTSFENCDNSLISISFANAE